MILNVPFGIVSRIFEHFNLKPIFWFNEGFLLQIVVIIVTVWAGFPFIFLVISGALKKIPKEYTEVVKLEGGNRWQVFSYGIFPAIRPIILLVGILQVLWTFNNFNLIFLLQVSNAAFSIDTLSSLIYWIGFGNQGTAGFTNAISVVILFFLSIFLIFYIRFLKFDFGGNDD
jgi:ABC-type sugar transport system permease subunit